MRRIFHYAIYILALIGTAVAFPLYPQQTSSTFSVSVNLIKVPFSVFDNDGELLHQLQRDDFRLWEDQIPQQIRSFGLDKNPVSVVLLIDTSETEKQDFKKIKEAAERFAEALSSEDRISIITFDDDVRIVQDWTSKVKDVRKALSRVELGLRTALYDAMYLAAADQLKNIEGRKAIILLTDCLNNQSSLGFNDAERAIIESQATLYVVSKTIMVRQAARKERRVILLSDIYRRLFGNVDYIDEFFARKEADMTSLAEKTGGRCFFPIDFAHLRDEYDEVARELKSKYYLTYVSNQVKKPDSFHTISLDYLPGASKITHRKGYYFQPAPTHKRRYSPKFSQ